MLAVLWRIPYKLSLRDLVEMFLVRGYAFSHETVRDWESRFAPLLMAQLRAKRRGRAGKSWYMDETYIKLKGRPHYLYRAIDRDGNLVDTMLSPTRDLAAARAFFKQAVGHVGHKPDRVTTDKHAAYPRAVRNSLGRRVRHLNNHIEHDHRAVKQRYYPMPGFGSFASAARFCSVFDEVRHFFRVQLSIPKTTPSLSQQRQTFSQRWVELFMGWHAI